MSTHKDYEIMRQCTSYASCSSPTCPLSSEGLRLPGEDKCIAEKRTRLKIGIKNELPMRGLLPRENSSIVREYGSVDKYIAKKFPDLVKE